MGLAAVALCPAGRAADPVAPPAHVTNYDESKVGTYTLPDPLVLNDGEPVRSAADWEARRRPEILELYRRYIYGRVPENAPRAVAAVESVDPHALGGTAEKKVVVIRFGEAPGAPFIRLIMYLPAGRTAPAPVLLHMTFWGESPPPPRPTPAPQAGAVARPRIAELGPIADMLARGYAYAFYRYSDLQPDNASARESGVLALTEAKGSVPAQDEWGTISVWAWGASRALDYLEGDPEVDGRRVALIGHSRLGKTALWAGAQDPRFALVLSSCGGEMGSSLSRRDYGETVDDLVRRYSWQFAPGFRQWVGRWSDMPVDAHMLIALNAPHPVMVTGGSGDKWADPRGEFLAEVAAGPVYRLLGRRDIGASEMPGLDAYVDSGDLAFRYHDGPHAIMPDDWSVFLGYADRYLRPGEPASPRSPRPPS
jgi:hypothetical protein